MTTKTTNKAKRWTHAVMGATLDELDAGVKLEGGYCTRSKFVTAAITEKVARTRARSAGADQVVAVPVRPVAQVNALVNNNSNGMAPSSTAELTQPEPMAGNPFPDVEG